MAEAFGQGVLKLSLLGQNQDEVRSCRHDWHFNDTNSITFN